MKIYYWTPVGSIPSDFTTAVGSATIFAHTDLTITKNGGRGMVSGDVTFEIKDIYDFNPGSFIKTPAGSMNTDEIHQVIKCLGARNFDQTTSYTMKLTNSGLGSLRYNLINCDDSNTCRI
jgi:hypothetical protein